MLRPAIAILFCLLWAPAGVARADETSANATPLQASLIPEQVHYTEPVYRAYVNAGGSKFAFIVPQGFRIQGDPMKGKLTLVNASGNCTLTFSVLDPAPADNRTLNSATYRDLLANRHPKAKILQESARGAGGRTGPAIDLEWKVADNLAQSQRAVFIPSSAGVLEFTATTTRANFASLQASLDLVLNTFACSTNGKLEVIHFSDKS